MKILISLVILGSLNVYRLARNEFVCLPCGQDCDGQVYNKEGACPSCKMKLVEKSTVHFKNISVKELCLRITSNPEAVLLDVRSAEEFKGSSNNMDTFGHFKNAININVNELETRVKEIEKYKGKEVMVYCSHAHRSAVASYFLSTHGFENVENMTGGVSTIRPQGDDCLTRSYIVHNH